MTINMHRGVIVDRLTGDVKHMTNKYFSYHYCYSKMEAAAKRKGLTSDRYEYRMKEVTM